MTDIASELQRLRGQIAQLEGQITTRKKAIVSLISEIAKVKKGSGKEHTLRQDINEHYKFIAGMEGRLKELKACK